MASFTELVDNVYEITNRPNLVTQTKLAVRAATLKAHHTDFYPKDIFETGIQWAEKKFIQSLDYRAVIPLWRAFKYLRKYDNSTPPGVATKFFSILTPEEVLDEYGIDKDDICYLAGSQIEIRSSTEDEFMLLGCYVHPNITETNYSSWIALDHPFAIVYEAAANIFKQTGYDEQFSVFQQMVLQEYQTLKQEITAQGY